MSATVSYRTEFEAAYIEKRKLHAHRYRIEVTVDGPQRYEDSERIIDYNKLAKYVKQVVPDGKWLLSGEYTPEEFEVSKAMVHCKIPISTLPYPTSIERMCQGLADELQDLLNRHEPRVRVIELKLRETNDSFATWRL